MASTQTLTGTSDGFLDSLRAYFVLTKPRITLLVLVTEYSGMWLAQGQAPGLWLTFITLFGTALAAASSSVLNNVVDRRIDAVMARTAGRPLPSGAVSAVGAAVYGALLGAASFVLMALYVNVLAASLALFTVFFYVGIYTIWLKRTTPMCTSIGGIAGALPPVIGWAAVANNIALAPLLLFGVLYLWQPPHFWALAIVRKEEYREAGIPMLPVVKGDRVTKRQMLLYTIALLPAVVLLYVAGVSGVYYLAVATLLTGYYLWLTIDFARKPVTIPAARRLFFFSILYLCILYIAVFADATPDAMLRLVLFKGI